MSELQAMIEQLIFGSDTVPGGIAGAVGLAEDHVVYELSTGERPSHPFMSFAFPIPASDVLYGPRHNDYVSVSEDPEAADRAILTWDNARELQLRLYFYGVEPNQTWWDVYAKAQAARGYLNAQANRDLAMAGYGGDIHVASPGTIRDASTALNAQEEIRLAIDVPLVVGERYELSVEAIEKLAMTFATYDEPEGPEEEIEL